MKKLLLVLFILVTINLQAQYPKHCPNDGQFVTWSTSKSQFSCSLATLPLTYAKVTHQFLDSYTASTGLFTSSQPDFTDLSGSASLSQLPGSGITTINSVPCTLGSSCTISSSGGGAATVDLVNQSAAITNSTLFTPSASGLFRIEWFAKVTRAATTSSTLGGFSTAWQDGTDSTSFTHNNLSETGASVFQTAGVTGNNLTTSLSGVYRIWANNTAITYSFGYASSGATTMQYEIHIRVYGPL